MNARAPYAKGEDNVRLIQNSVHAEDILSAICTDARRDSLTTALLFANICIFIALLFAVDGLDVRTTIVYAVAAIGALLALHVLLVRLLRADMAVRSKIRAVEGVGIGQDSIIALSLVFDLFAIEQTYPNSAIGWVAMAAFLTLPLSSRLLFSMLAGRSIIFMMCIIFVLLTEDKELPDITRVAPLIMAYFISIAMGYWLFLRSTQQWHTRMEIHAVQAVTARQNRALEEARRLAEQNAEVRTLQ